MVICPSTTQRREVASVAAKAAAPPPPARMITAAQYASLFQAVMGVYALQMLLVPAKMISDHFNAAADQLTQFWIRGSAVAFFGIVYAVRTLPSAEATTLAFFASLGCAVLYPFNAKFNLLKNNLSVKYPMHYVPEVLLGGLTLLGAYVMYA